MVFLRAAFAATAEQHYSACGAAARRSERSFFTATERAAVAMRHDVAAKTMRVFKYEKSHFRHRMSAFILPDS